MSSRAFTKQESNEETLISVRRGIDEVFFTTDTFRFHSTIIKGQWTHPSCLFALLESINERSGPNWSPECFPLILDSFVNPFTFRRSDQSLQNDCDWLTILEQGKTAWSSNYKCLRRRQKRKTEQNCRINVFVFNFAFPTLWHNKFPAKWPGGPCKVKALRNNQNFDFRKALCLRVSAPGVGAGQFLFCYPIV